MICQGADTFHIARLPWWPAALLTGNLLLTLAVFIGVVVAWLWGGGVGPADGKLMVGMAAFAPPALGLGALLELTAFTVLRLRGRRAARFPVRRGSTLAAY